MKAHALLIASLLAAPVAAGTVHSALPAPEGVGAPLEARLAQVFALAGAAPSQAALDHVASLDAPARDALDALLAAYLAYAAEAARIAAAGTGAWSALDAHHDALRAAALHLAATPAPTATGGFDPTDPVRIELACDAQPHDTYTMDAVLIVDACGDDTYLNNAGGTIHVAPGATRCTRIPVAPNVHAAAMVSAAVLDLAGRDTYAPADDSCGVNGGGVLGAGFLLDAAGDDTYTAGSLGANGGGHLGSGYLLDLAGRDAYTAQDQGVNGGAYVLARGSLVDVAGDDTYTVTPGATRGVNGGGYFAAAGLLVDLEGGETFDDGETFACAGAVCRMHGVPPLADAIGLRIA